MSVRPLVLALFVVVASAPHAWAEQRGQAKEQVEFGIQVVQIDVVDPGEKKSCWMSFKATIGPCLHCTAVCKLCVYYNNSMLS